MLDGVFMYRVAIMVYPDAEELDFVGPFETISSVNEIKPLSIEVTIVAKTMEAVRCYNGLRVLPDTTFSGDVDYDILLVPGGEGRHRAMYDEDVIGFIEKQTRDLIYLCSVCTGAFVLAEAGILEDLKATTHHSALNELERSYPGIEVLEERIVKNDTEPKIWLAAGISAGIDLSIEMIKDVFGEDIKAGVTERMEYPSNCR